MPAFMLAGRLRRSPAPTTASVFCVLWILKLGLHAPRFGTLARVVSNERAPIASVLILFVIVPDARRRPRRTCWSACRQPEQFGSLPGAMWWAVVTLHDDGLRRRACRSRSADA